jgi:hypothetical protein
MAIGLFILLLAVVIFVLGFRGTYAILPPFNLLTNISPLG